MNLESPDAIPSSRTERKELLENDAITEESNHDHEIIRVENVPQDIIITVISTFMDFDEGQEGAVLFIETPAVRTKIRCNHIRVNGQEIVFHGHYDGEELIVRFTGSEGEYPEV
jgi:hypothetical protein